MARPVDMVSRTHLIHTVSQDSWEDLIPGLQEHILGYLSLEPPPQGDSLLSNAPNVVLLSEDILPNPQGLVSPLTVNRSSAPDNKVNLMETPILFIRS